MSRSLETLLVGERQPLNVIFPSRSASSRNDEPHFDKALADSKKLDEYLKNNHLAEGINTVLYIASGFDIGPTFLLFSNATTVIGVDAHAFSTARDVVVDSKIELDHKGFVDIHTIDNATSRQGSAPEIISNLQRTFANFRLINTTVIKVGDYTAHGIVEFDLGPGTPLRRYIHIHADIPSTRFYFESKIEPSPWVEKLARFGYEALLIKGAMAFYSSTPYHPYGSGNDFLHHLSRVNGVVVDTDGALRPEYKNSMPSYENYPWVEGRPRPHLAPYAIISTDVETGYGLSFSYGSTTIIKYQTPQE